MNGIRKYGVNVAAWSVAVLLGVSTLAAPARSASARPQQQSSADREQERLEREQEREQEKREREEEAREREQEKREREQERLERLEELYDEGREALEEDRFDQAIHKFSELVSMNGPQTDAALYWKAYAENKQGKKDAALASIGELKRRFAQSRWKKDAEALEIETRQSTGQKPNLENVPDDDLKILALQGVMNNDPARGVKILEQRLNGSGSPREKAKALFVLAQSGSSEAMEVVARVAQGQSNPELQRKAVEYLGIFGGGRSHAMLQGVYASVSDEGVKRAVLRAYMLSGDRASLLAAAKAEKNDALKREAIRQLGLTGGQSELQQLYQADSSTEVRRELLQAFFLSGDSSKLVEVAQNEKDPDLRRTAIRNLGLMGSGHDRDALQNIYNKETDRSLKEEVLNAYFLQGNAKALIVIAKAEKDPGLKKRCVEKLSIMGSKEATDYLMELLK
jgi:HEAT repeat protein